MLKGILLSAAVGAAALFAVSAQAAPISSQPLLSDGSSSLLEQIAQGCGRGYHRGPAGGCRRNMSASYPCYWVRGAYGWRMVCR